ncbi:hypothetical protein HBI56_161900 [Parastagonospora nodorum]|nr:hypothetical protein HBH56_210740 [Parastagonospora nodorum]QRD05960.1 hypothetical protein JI435_133830 [Parastagonospora nodorum SN15]KAH3931408.1 hypothetical protein HBH54_099350 [Parastagonospora nodorum]KAH3944375.1 hypothetical protein HBH53_160800 [Parastagonospora nodorum]KAH3960744.1 hypothetical protein HBH51_189100 [Parastagonospora nodorum]
MTSLFGGKTRGKLAPTIFNDKGQFRRQLGHLNSRIKRSEEKTQKPGMRRNSDLIADMTIEDVQIKCSAWKTFPAKFTTSLIFVFTRASGEAPSGGRAGMFRRAQVAGEAFAALLGQKRPILFAIPRCRVSSRAYLFNEKGERTGEPGHSLKELWDVLKVAKPDRDIYLVCVGLDAFTTNVQNYITIAKLYDHLSITIVVVVNEYFAGSKSSGRQAAEHA